MATRIASIDPNTMWYFTLVVLTVALLGGTVWAYRVWDDLKGEPEEGLTDPTDLLSPLSQAFYAGQMSAEEYQRIKESVDRVVTPGQPPTVSVPSRVVPSNPAGKGSESPPPERPA